MAHFLGYGWFAFVLAVFVPACLESNPQPSPGGGGGSGDGTQDAIIASEDTSEAPDLMGDTTAGDVAADVSPADTACVPDCGGKECGPDGCDGQCGECPAGDQWACVEHMCICTLDCEGKECGIDGCGGSCGECGKWEDCWVEGLCYEKECLYHLNTRHFFEPVFKLHMLSTADGGVPGMALDVDDDPSTCAPALNCQDGLDNTLGAFLARPELAPISGLVDSLLISGELVILGELINVGWGDPWEQSEGLIAFWDGVPAHGRDVCDWQAPDEKCEYFVTPETYDFSACMPFVGFDNVTISDGHMSAGGPDHLFSFVVPLEQQGLIVTAVMARIEGDIVFSENGFPVGVQNGVFGGAIPLELIKEGLEVLPEGFAAPLSNQDLLDLVDEHLVPDIDAGDEYGLGLPDGTPDSVSIGVRFEAAAAEIIGVIY